MHLVDHIGEEVIAWECDYRHSDSTWPESPEWLVRECEAAGLSGATMDKISWENAARFFRFDPFQHTERADATVASLRSQAGDVDTAVTSRAEYRRRFEFLNAC